MDGHVVLCVGGDSHTTIIGKKYSNDMCTNKTHKDKATRKTERCWHTKSQSNGNDEVGTAGRSRTVSRGCYIIPLYVFMNIQLTTTTPRPTTTITIMAIITPRWFINTKMATITNTTTIATMATTTIATTTPRPTRRSRFHSAECQLALDEKFSCSHHLSSMRTYLASLVKSLADWPKHKSAFFLFLCQR